MSFLDKIFGKNSKEPKFEPYTVDTEFGKFTMEYYMTKPLHAYTGVINYPEAKELDGINVEIECDSEDTFEMKKGLALLRKIISERNIWIEKARQYAAEMFLCDDRDGMVKIYAPPGYEDAFVTIEEYKALLHPVGIDISPDGNICFDMDGDYNGNNIFQDHGLTVEFDEEGNIIS